MSTFATTTIELGEKGSNYQKYKIHVTFNTSKVFFLIGDTTSNNYAAIVDHNNNVIMYVNFPIPPCYYYVNRSQRYKGSRTAPDGTYITPVGSGEYGTAPLYTFDYSGYSTDWITVPISRGNNRKGTVTITAGVRVRRAYADDYTFGDSIATKTLETTEISTANFSGNPNVTINSDGTVTISGTYTNPDNYYRVQILKRGTSNVLYTSPENATTYSYTYILNDSDYGTTQNYIVRFVGKNGSTYGVTKDVQVVIPKKSYKIFAKISGPTIVPNKAFYFNNNSTKREFKDIYIKVEGQVYKIKR